MDDNETQLNVLRDLKRVVGDDHEYSAAIDEMIAEVGGGR